jgi:hypothetical protein
MELITLPAKPLGEATQEELVDALLLLALKEKIAYDAEAQVDTTLGEAFNAFRDDLRFEKAHELLAFDEAIDDAIDRAIKTLVDGA